MPLLPVPLRTGWERPFLLLPCWLASRGRGSAAVSIVEPQESDHSPFDKLPSSLLRSYAGQAGGKIGDLSHHRRVEKDQPSSPRPRGRCMDYNLENSCFSLNNQVNKFLLFEEFDPGSE